MEAARKALARALDLRAGAPHAATDRLVSKGFVLGTEAASPPGMNTYHAAVWLDHSEARIFHIAKDGFDETVLQTEKPHRHLHRKSGPGAVSGRRGMIEPAFYDDIVRALGDSHEILILGPATAKLELIHHVHKHHASLSDRIVGVETVDHPTDRQIVAYARKYFEVVDAAKK